MLRPQCRAEYRVGFTHCSDCNVPLLSRTELARITNARCPDCSASMEEGFVLDRVEGGSLPNAWVEGPRKRSFGLGVQSEPLEIATFRCVECGLLKSYARPIEK